MTELTHREHNYVPPAPVNPNEIFQREMAVCTSRNWQVRHYDPVSRVAVFYSPAGNSSPVANLIACLLTGFLWAPIWIIIAWRTPGPRTMTLTVSETGEVHYTKPGPPGKA